MLVSAPPVVTSSSITLMRPYLGLRIDKGEGEAVCVRVRVRVRVGAHGRLGDGNGFNEVCCYDDFGTHQLAYHNAV